MIEVVCPGCGKSLSVSEKLAGKKVRCPQCKSVVEIPEAGQAPAQSVRWLDCPCGNTTGVENAKAGMRVSCKCGRQFVLADSGFIEVAAGPPAHIATAHAIEPARASSILGNKPLLAAAGGAVVLAAVAIAFLSGGEDEPEKAAAPAGEPEEKRAAGPVAEAEREPPAESRAPVRPGIETEREEPVVERPVAKAEEEALEPPPAPPVEPEPRAEAAAVEPERAVTVAPPPGTKSLADVMEEVARSVVMVRRRRGHGSGFLVKAPAGDAWYVATNRHVIEGALELKVFGFRGKEKVELSGAKIHAVHKDVDLALVSIDPPPPGFEPVRFGEPGKVRQGDEVFAYGSPGGVEADKVLEQTGTNGIVSACGREIEGQRCFQTTAAVNPGNSGGPLFTRGGEVVGINTYATSLAGTNFAVEAGYLIKLLRGENSIPEEEAKELVLHSDPMRELRKRTVVAEARVKQPVTKMLLDAERKKLVALVSAENSFRLYELPGLEEAGELFVGSDPVDFDYDAASARAVVSLATPPQIAVFDVEKMKRVSLVETKNRIYAIRWLKKGVAIAIREDAVPKSAAGPETKVLRVSLVSTSNGRFMGNFKNEVLRKEAREARRQVDALKHQLRFRTYGEAESAGKVLGAWKARLKAFETAFWSPALGLSPDRRTLLIAEADEGGERTIYKLGTTSTAATPRRFKGEVHFFLPAGEEGYDPGLRIAFARKGMLFVAGDGVCDLSRSKVVGAVKKIGWVWDECRELCNIFAVNSDASLGFTGTHIFDLKKFTPVARLPLRISVMALGPEDKVLYAFDERRYAIVGLSVEKLLEEGLEGSAADVGAEREEFDTLAETVEELMRRKELDEAESKAKELAILYPRSSRARMLLAKAFLMKGDAAGAESAAKEALRLDPKNSEAESLLELAKKELKQGWDRAVAVACERAEIEPDDPEIVRRAVSLLLRTRKNQFEAVGKAMGFTEKLVERTQKKDAGALALLAETCLYAGDFERARDFALEGKRLDPRCEGCARVLGLAKDCLRQFAQGLKLVCKEDFSSAVGSRLMMGTPVPGTPGVVRSVILNDNPTVTVRVDSKTESGVVLARVKAERSWLIVAPDRRAHGLTYGAQLSVPRDRWWVIRACVNVPVGALSSSVHRRGGPTKRPVPGFDTLSLYCPTVRTSFLVDEVRFFALQEAYAGKRVIWRDFCDTPRRSRGHGMLSFADLKGARGGVAAYPLMSGTNECEFNTCQYDSRKVLVAVRYFIEARKPGKLHIACSFGARQVEGPEPSEIPATPDRWHEVAVAFRHPGRRWAVDTQLTLTAEGFEEGDTLFVDEVRLLEK